MLEQVLQLQIKVFLSTQVSIGSTDTWHRPFQFGWWFWLALTGVNLAFTVSCKWVGLFTIATIGCSTVMDLWRILGDLHVTKVRILMYKGEKAVFNILFLDRKHWVDTFWLDSFAWYCYHSLSMSAYSMFIFLCYHTLVMVMCTCLQLFNIHWQATRYPIHLLVRWCLHCSRTQTNIHD